MLLVFINRVRVDKNIININNGEVTERVKNVIHDILKFAWSIFKAKWHNIQKAQCSKDNVKKLKVNSLKIKNNYKAVEPAKYI